MYLSWEPTTFALGAGILSRYHTICFYLLIICIAEFQF